MSNRENGRVLGRVGDRELTPEELARVAAAGPQMTNVITFGPKGRDGDG